MSGRPSAQAQAAQPVCGAPCHAGLCRQQGCESQQDSIQYIIGDCIPDGQGGCQRSTPGLPSSCCSPTCLDPAQESCCQSDSNVHEPSCQDECCSGSRPPCVLDPSSIECHQGGHSPPMEDECCSDCAPNSRSERGQSDTGAHSSGMEDECCSSCAPKSLSGRGQMCPVGAGLTAENEVASTATAPCGVPSEHYCKGHPDFDHLVTSGTYTKGPTHEKHPHSRFNCGKTRNAKCRSESILGRFFEAACCCLIDWRVRPHKHHRHHHSHSHSHLSDPHLEVKKQSKLTTRPGHQPVATEGTAEQGGGNLQTLVLTVRGMDCPSCAGKLTRALQTLPSVQGVKVNIFTGQASLAYREGLILPSNIGKRATKLTGFTCVVADESPLEGNYRVLRIKFQTNAGLTRESLVLPPGVAILKASHAGSSVVFDVQYDAAMIQPRSVLNIFVPSGGSFLPPSKRNTSAQLAGDITSLLRRTLISALLCIPVIIFSWAPLQPHPIIYGAISLSLATCIQFYVGAPLCSAAFRALFIQHVFDMDVLVALSSTIAYVFSLVAYIMQATGHGFSTPFFETPTLLLTFITLGKFISAYSRRRATSALDGLGTLQPDLVQIVSADGATVSVIHVDLVQSHDVLRVPSNTLIPTDGILLRGLTQVDESALTGESLPVDKAPGAPLMAGTRNMTHSVDMEVARLPAENSLAELASLVAGLQEARLPIQDLADRAASLLAPVIFIVAAIVFVVWIVVGLRIRGEALAGASLAALRYTIAVLIVSCPCAIVLCVPMVIVITGAVAIREGVLFKTAIAVQQAKNTTVAVFDKTGTLTLGQMSVVEAHVTREDAVGTTLALVSQDSHPVARAVAKYLSATYPHISAVPLSGQVQSFLGKGLEMTFNDVRVRGGNPKWLGLQTEPHYSLMMRKALTMFAVTIDTKVVAFFGLADRPRTSAATAIEILKRQGIQVHIVSGDMRPVVCALAKQLGIPHERARGGCLPAEKVAYVRALKATGARVMFVGDGTNDTPALAAADISVAMGSGTDVARSAADVVFLAPDLARSLTVLLRLSRGAARRVYMNFAWAAIYNLLAVLLAAGALVEVRIAPEYAALGEVVSVVPVVIVAWSMWFLKF